MRSPVSRVSPVSLDMAAAPFDLFIARTGKIGHQIHLSQSAGTASMNTALFNTGWRGHSKLAQ